jgi:nucleoside-triphosphatase THEP1
MGKTTLVQKIIERIGLMNTAGFIAAEIRPEGSRLGFELLSFLQDTQSGVHRCYFSFFLKTSMVI